MVLLAVLAETLSVIATEYDNGIAIERIRLQKSDESPDLRVRKRNLAVVRTFFILFAVMRGRTIRIVRVVQVHPKEEFVLAVLAQPVQRHISHHISRALHLLKI